MKDLHVVTNDHLGKINFSFRSKHPVSQLKTFEILGFFHYEFEMLGILRKIASISKAITGKKNDHLLQLFFLFPDVWTVTNRRKAEVKSFITFAPTSSTDTGLILGVGIVGTKLIWMFSN